MKDTQGVMRGKCNECGECEEYVKPAEGARCDYCGHVPTQHVQIIQLGPCKCGECDEYISDKEFSYTDCQYCGCKATEHKGADKLKKKQSSVTTMPPKGTPPDATHASRLHPPGSSNNGTKCKFPGCDKPCFSEGGKQHDFCGRTHAKKYNEQASEQASTMPSYGKPPLLPFAVNPRPPPLSTTRFSSDQQPPPPSYISVMSDDNPPTRLSSPPRVSSTTLTPSSTTTAATIADDIKQLNISSSDNDTVGGGGGGGAQSSPGVKMCYDCRKHPANKGYNICEGCYKHRTT